MPWSSKSLTYKVLTTAQPSYLHNFRPPRSTRSSSVVTLSRPPTISSLKITDRSFGYASPRLWNQLPDSFRQPHHSCLDSPPHSLLNSSLSSSLYTSKCNLLLIYRPRNSKGWKAELASLADLQRTVYPHKWSAVGRAQDRESSPVRDRRSSTVLRCLMWNKSTQRVQTPPRPLQCRPLVSNNIWYKMHISHC